MYEINEQMHQIANSAEQILLRLGEIQATKDLRHIVTLCNTVVEESKNIKNYAEDLKIDCQHAYIEANKK